MSVRITLPILDRTGEEREILVPDFVPYSRDDARYTYRRLKDHPYWGVIYRRCLAAGCSIAQAHWACAETVRIGKEASDTSEAPTYG